MTSTLGGVSRVAVMILLAGACACSTPPLAVRPTPFPGLTLEIDESPAWSHDGRMIAFHRRIPSSYGPAGVYLTTPFGGEPRFLAAAGFYHPTDLTFSPDDRYLAGMDGYELWICDVATGQVSRPMYTSEGMFKPDWSPDGKKIAYSRLPLPSNPDSGGIHVFDLETGADTALTSEGRIVYSEGDGPLWTRDGNWIACTDRYGTEPERVLLVEPGGSERRVVISGGDWHELRRYYRPARGRDGFLFAQAVATSPVAGAYYVNADGSGLVRTAWRFVNMRAFSPDGSEFVGGIADPSDTNFVLAVFMTDDPTGTSRRPITRYEPPPGQTLEQALAPMAQAAREPKRLALRRGTEGE